MTLRGTAVQKALLALALLTAAGSWAQDTAIYQQGGSGVYESIAGALKGSHASEGLGGLGATVTVSTDPSQASGQVKEMASKGAKFLYALGPGAASLAAQTPGVSGVYIFVPNPAGVGLTARSGWVGVSPYPDPRVVLQHLRGTMKIQRVAVLYTRKSNQEVAQAFESAAKEEGMGCALLGLKGPQELQAQLLPALKQTDALLLLLDPLAFNADSLRFVVNACLQEKKPTIGFLDSVASSGVPFAFYPTSDEIAKASAAAMKGLREKKEDRVIKYAQKFVLSVNENAAKSLGTPFDAQKVVKRY